MERQTGTFSYPSMNWWWGVVEERKKDPKKLGRVRVRIYGHYTGDLGKIPTESMPWAAVLQPITSAGISGVGQSPTGIVEGATVWGIFLDGENAQVPMVVGTIAGYGMGEGFEGGFKDPNGKFPREPGENDVNRLARNERIDETIVQKKRDGRDDADVAFGGNWQEPEVPYQAEYPMNHVRESESGHIEEWDDTEGAERLHRYHKSGTFEEDHPSGTKVQKIVKDQYTIVHGDDYVLIKGNANVTVDGTCNILVKGNANIEVNGNVREHIHGNYRLNVDGNWDIQVDGHLYANSDTHMKLTAPRIDENP